MVGTPGSFISVTFLVFSSKTLTFTRRFPGHITQSEWIFPFPALSIDDNAFSASFEYINPVIVVSKPRFAIPLETLKPFPA